MVDLVKTTFWLIVHFFTGCKEEYLESMNKGKRLKCKKCGTIYFNWERW